MKKSLKRGRTDQEGVMALPIDMSWASHLAPAKLLTMLERNNADIVLIFDNERRLPAHSAILGLMSQPLVSSQMQLCLRACTVLQNSIVFFYLVAIHARLTSWEQKLSSQWN